MDNFEKQLSRQMQNEQMKMLRDREGIHAPLKLAMEIKALSSVGRHPFLPSSNALLDSLTGADELIDFADFLSPREFSETMRTPHVVMEKHLNIQEVKK